MSLSGSKLSTLLKPLTRKSPCGESLRYAETYDQPQEARREEDEHLPQGVWKTNIKKADWDQVARLCCDALKTRTKDAQIAAWLTKAGPHPRGIEGLVDGLELILELTRTFERDIHPQLKEGKYRLRLVSYDWINTSLKVHAQLR